MFSASKQVFGALKSAVLQRIFIVPNPYTQLRDKQDCTSEQTSKGDGMMKFILKRLKCPI